MQCICSASITLTNFFIVGEESEYLCNFSTEDNLHGYYNGQREEDTWKGDLSQTANLPIVEVSPKNVSTLTFHICAKIFLVLPLLVLNCVYTKY